jgi:hypothetical protein
MALNNWSTQLNAYPSQSFAFVVVNETAYALFLSWRIDSNRWRAFMIPNARCQRDLFGGEQTRWSTDLFAEAGLLFREEQLVEAQAALVRILAARLGLKEAEILPARNGRPVADKRLSQAQVYQVAKSQPATRRR